MFTLDTTTTFGARIADDLVREEVIWLTTVDADGTPQPSPVWFLWTGAEFLIFSQPNKRKLNNIARSPRVSLNLRGDELGDEIAVFTGDATLEGAGPSRDERASYDVKYAASIARIGYTPQSFAQDYSVPLRVVPDRLRGF